MGNDLRIEKLTQLGIGLLQEERELALSGDFDGLTAVTERKEAYLAQLGDLAEQLQTAPATQITTARRQELETLFDIVRRRAEENAYLLKAAEAGMRSAKRDIDRLMTGETELGAYSANGEPVESKYKSTNLSEFF